MLGKFKEKYIGSRDFYMYALAIAVPMILQNVVTNFVSMLDNIMVGQIGTEQMSGVAISNEFLFVFNLTIFGAVSGPGIFGAQFFGKGDHKGQMYTFRFRLIVSTIITIVYGLLFFFFDKQLVSLFLHKGGEAGDIDLALTYGRQYLRIMIFCLLPFSAGQTYSSAVRECGETKIPMIASFSAVIVNLVLDYGLIFGHLGLPQMGVRGAAIATCIAKFIEAAFVIIWVHTHKNTYKFIEETYKGISIPGDLTGRMIRKGLPLLFNEFLWSAGMATVFQCYAYKGLDVVAAQNIARTITNLLNVVYLQIGMSIAIIVGQKLGAGKLDEARADAKKMQAFSIMVASVVMLVGLPVAHLFPSIYNTQDSIKALATYFITIQSLVMPLWSYTNSSYFIIRSGGKTGITFLFDSGYTWGVMIPVIFCISRFTGLDIRMIFFIGTYLEVIKVATGFFMVRSGKWVVNLTDMGTNG
ncbi:MAG: MATE family efflux transporter [Lachnospiraceae bacterium]|nr:MATE family efflux transporter [Lachnospiraceae bacterium]